MRLLVTGGAGFIGSHFIKHVLRVLPDSIVVNLDRLTYAGNLESLAEIAADPRHRFVRGDIADAALVDSLVAAGIDVVVNFAAESHVDRSIMDSAPFVRTNIQGTHVLLEAARRFGVRRFLQVSTDEVYGPAPQVASFSEARVLNPSSPYAASKAAADLLCLAYAKTYRLPLVVTRCTNNYGPYQFPEKFIPLVITHALEDKPIPIYGDGQQERDWLFVEDHCSALVAVLQHADPGSILNIASGRTASNIRIAETVLETIGAPRTLLRFVDDRPAHDRRYALDASLMSHRFGWTPRTPLDEGLAGTIDWYREHRSWWERVRTGAYLRHYEAWYAQRLTDDNPASSVRMRGDPVVGE